MTTYKELYLHLFNVITDAIEALEEGHIVIAVEEMKKAQILVEEEVLKVDIMLEKP